MNFTIKQIQFSGEPFYEFIVLVEMSAKDWSKAKAKRQLGHLYGVDISNAVHRQNEAIRAWNPTVDDRRRSKDGIKRIQLVYGHRDNRDRYGL